MKNLCRILLAVLVLAGAGRAAEEPVEVPDAVDSKVDIATRRAIDFLLTQQKSDGSIFDAGNQTAMTAHQYHGDVRVR